MSMRAHAAPHQPEGQFTRLWRTFDVQRTVHGLLSMRLSNRMCASAASAGAGRASTPFRPFLQFSRRPLPSGAASPFCGPRAYGGRRDKCGTRRFSVNSASPHLNRLSTFGPINDGGAAFILGAARWMAAGANRDPADAGGDHNDSHLQGLVRLGGVHWCPLNLRLRRQKSLFRNRWLRIPMMPPGHTEVEASTCSDLMPPTVLR